MAALEVEGALIAHKPLLLELIIESLVADETSGVASRRRLESDEPLYEITSTEDNGSGPRDGDDDPDIPLAVPSIPGEVALILSQQPHIGRLAADVARAMHLTTADSERLHREMVGAISDAIEAFLP